MTDRDSSKRAELIEKLLAKKGLRKPAGQSSQAGQPPIAKRPPDHPPELSLGQERLFFLQQLDPLGSLYNMPAATEVRGSLSLDALGKALRLVVNRHEALRTTIELVDGQPTVEIAQDVDVPLEVESFTEIDGEEQREEALATWLDRETSRPFVLSRAPLVRAALAELGERHGRPSFVLLLVVHHIACDQWSLGILQGELIATYRRILAGEAPDLPEPALQYPDFAAWQKRRVEDEALQGDLRWWVDRLRDAPRSLALPYDHARPRHFGMQGDRVHLPVNADLAAAIEGVARESQATPFMIWLAAWGALLSATAGQRRLTVGAPIAARQRAELAGLVGFVANTIVFDLQVDDEASFRDLIEAVKTKALAAYAHQDVSFEEIVQELNPTRELGATPLFSVMMVYDDAAAAQSTDELEVTPRDVGYGGARFDLTLVVTPSPQPSAFIELAVDLFDRRTVERMAARLLELLKGALAAPEMPLRSLITVPADERRELLAQSGVEREPPRVTVLERFVTRTAESPDHPALVSGPDTMSYAELDQRRQVLATALAEAGVGRGDRLGILMDRSFDCIATVLAAMTLGAAYVPVDPRNPRTRIEAMFVDAGVRLVVTDKRHAHLIPVTIEGPVVPFVVAETVTEPASPRPSPAGPSVEDVAYVIYTSGSTGKPKGVQVSHGALASTIEGLVAMLDPQADDRVLQFVSLGFDVAASEIFQALATGATLVVADRDRLVPGPALVALLRQERVTIVSMPASVLAALPVEPLPALRALIVGGEVCPPSVVEAWSKGRRMYNCYGPTETAITATYAEARSGRFAGIGCPLFGARCFILDESLALAPYGVFGQLAIGGAGVGLGYLHQPGLTAERFVPDPFSSHPGRRLYLTGDRARWRSDGNIEFAGRDDEQVKIRGHRVELAECESVIRTYPGVTEAAVMPREQGESLVAYLVSEGADVDVEELRGFLRARLPEYMVPSAFMTLESLPRLSSGKLDRKSLPKPQGATQGKERVEPRDDLERTIATIWERVLDTRPIGVTDDFFEIGGNSFSIMKLLTEVEIELGCRLSHSVLFERGTVAEMAELVRERRDRSDGAARVRLRKGKDAAPVYCVHPVGGNVLCYGMLSRLIDKTHPVWGVQARGAEQRGGGGEDEPHPPRHDLVEMAEAYVDEIIEAHPNEPVALLGWSFGATVAYEMAGRLRDRDHPVALLGLLDATAPWAVHRNIDNAGLMAQLLRDLSGLFGVTPPSYDQLRELTIEELEAIAVEHVKPIQLFKPGTELSEVRRHVDLYRAHMNAHLHYQPRAYDVDVLYVAAVGSAYRKESRERWHSLVKGDLHEVEIDARHADILQRPHVNVVAAAINEALTEIG